MCSLQIRSCSFPPITDSSPCSAWCALPHTHILFHSADNQGQTLEPQEKVFSQHMNCIFSLCMARGFFNLFHGDLFSMLCRHSFKYVFSLGQRNFCYSTLSPLLLLTTENSRVWQNKKKNMQSFTKLVGFYLLVTSYLFKLHWNTSFVPSSSGFCINLWLCVLLLTSWGFTYVQ